MYCISISGLSFAVHRSVLSAYCVFILLHCVSCSVVFLYSLWVTFCLPVLTSGPFFQCEALFLHLYLRRWPHFVEVLSSCCIKALSLFLILRLRPRIILRLCPHILFWGFGLVFYFEASSSYFILRLRPRFILIVLIFYFEVSASYFNYFEASSSYFLLRLCPHTLF